MDSLTRETISTWLPARPEAGHKGVFGHLFVVAGARGFTGAARLVCEAAYRTGAGLVTLGVARPLADVMAVALRETMTLPLPATEAESLALQALDPVLAFARERDALVLGPGLGQHPGTAALARALAAQAPPPAVVDADALNALSEAGAFAGIGALADYSGAPRVFTPHPGEMARLTGRSTVEIQSDRAGFAARYAQAWGVVVVLKGHGTVVAAPDGRVAVNTTGNNGMGTGGAGDVLAGMLGAFLAQGMPPYEAACAAVWAHGRGGDLAAAAKTMRGMIAGDIIDYLPDVWRELEGA